MANLWRKVYAIVFTISKKTLLKACAIKKESIPLHPLRKRDGRVAQLNRVADYGSAGYRFESCRGHSS